MNASRTLVIISTVALLLAGSVLSGCDDGARTSSTDGPGRADDPAAAEADPIAAAPDTASPMEADTPDAAAPAPGAGTAPDADPATAPSAEAVEPDVDQDIASAGSPGAEDERPAAGAGVETGETELAGEASGGVSPDSILRATARAYEDVRAIRARFEQRLENPLLGRNTRSEGTIYQRQPDRFLMEFSDPAGDVIVSDGEYFWMWYPSVDSTQVLRTRRGGTGLDLRSQFIGDPVQRFETTYHGTEPVRGRTAHVFTLVPREGAGYTRLKAWIDADDHLVRRFELAESSGNVRHFELTDLTVNPTLPDDLFAFTPPPGARVVTR